MWSRGSVSIGTVDRAVCHRLVYEVWSADLGIGFWGWSFIIQSRRQKHSFSKNEQLSILWIDSVNALSSAQNLHVKKLIILLKNDLTRKILIWTTALPPCADSVQSLAIVRCPLSVVRCPLPFSLFSHCRVTLHANSAQISRESITVCIWQRGDGSKISDEIRGSNEWPGDINIWNNLESRHHNSWCTKLTRNWLWLWSLTQ